MFAQKGYNNRPSGAGGFQRSKQTGILVSSAAPAAASHKDPRWANVGTLLAADGGGSAFRGSFFSLHFLELRYRAIYFLFSLCITFLIGACYTAPLTHLICTPFSSGTEERSFFIFTHLTEGFYAALECSLMYTLCFSTPLLIYQLYSFFIPSCYQEERRAVHRILLAATLLFFISFLFAAIILLPKICAFLQQFQYESKSMEIKLEARIAPAIRWSCRTALFTALLFQTPVLFALLLNWGVIEPCFLQQQRKYAFFSLLLVASLLSPPDVSSQSVLAVTGCVIYEFFLWWALFYHRWYNSPKEE